MARYKVILAYDGTGYSGFQRQTRKPEASTVQGAFEAALRKLGWKGRAILFAGRTDAGVHASGQVVAFDLDWKHSSDKLFGALNALLPEEVAVRYLSEIGKEFHPRYDAQSRQYRYRIFCDPVRNPLQERYAWRVWPAVEIARLNQAAAVLVGTHDFRAFGTAPRSGGTTIRSIHQASWQEDPTGLFFDVQANAFLFRMVRRLVGFQVQVGKGELEIEELQSRLQDPSLGLARWIAPPQGLTLIAVNYSL